MTFPVTDTGPAVADNAHTVVLLHGFPQNRASWQDVSARLNQAGLRTLAPDLRGLPEGARPRRRRDYRVERLVEDVDALLDAAGLASATSSDTTGAQASHGRWPCGDRSGCSA